MPLLSAGLKTGRAVRAVDEQRLAYHNRGQEMGFGKAEASNRAF